LVNRTVLGKVKEKELQKQMTDLRLIVEDELMLDCLVVWPAARQTVVSGPAVGPSHFSVD
jgi:hypothetical protein